MSAVDGMVFKMLSRCLFLMARPLGVLREQKSRTRAAEADEPKDERHESLREGDGSNVPSGASSKKSSELISTLHRSSNLV